ncbi:winged helix-turn-helix domain-containing protein [Streptosporangium lutulentum]
MHTAQGEGTFVGSPGETMRKNEKHRYIKRSRMNWPTASSVANSSPAAPVPSESTLVQQYGVARETVRHAIGLLREQGWVYTVPQRGTYVSRPEEWPDTTEEDT